MKVWSQKNQSPHDVASYREEAKALSSKKLYDLIKNVFKPVQLFPFPKKMEHHLDWNVLWCCPWL